MRLWYAVTAAVALGFLGVLPGLAADLPVKAPAVTVVSAVDRWTGFYFGANVGYGWHTGSSIALFTNDRTPPFNLGDSETRSRGTMGSINGDGVIAGGQIGFNWQFAPSYLIGIEADIQYSDIRDGVSGRFTNPNGRNPNVGIDGTAKTDIKWFGTVRGRIGFVTDDWLLYITGGLAFGQIEYTVLANEVGPEAFLRTWLSTDSTRAGYVVGGGVERLLGANFTIKVEYQFIDLGSVDASALVRPIALAPGERASLGSMSFNIHTVRIGLNYKLMPPAL